MAAAADCCSMAPQESGLTDMMTFLKDVLNKLELAQGGIDDEARQGLELLRKKTQELEAAKLGSSQTRLESAPVPTNADIAQKIDRLQGDLSSLEQKLDQMDETTRSMVAHSTALWMAEPAQGNSSAAQQ